ncbi:hypothetical protein C8Q77DRAFT_1130087 [Trametes polyzona]|nr:hypothetical protein C8Q77DRAFT_1130087 [Trametes polyzona]
MQVIRRTPLSMVTHKARRTATNPKSPIARKIHRCLSWSLRKLTGDRTATMWWTRNRLHHTLFVERRVRLEGWPEDLPFQSLHKLTMKTLINLERLRSMKILRLVRVEDDGEYYSCARDPSLTVPGPADEGDSGMPNSGRDDIKKSRFDPVTGKPISRKRKLRVRGAITPKFVDDEDHDDEDEGEDEGDADYEDEDEDDHDDEH